MKELCDVGQSLGLLLVHTAYVSTPYNFLHPRPSLISTPTFGSANNPPPFTIGSVLALHPFVSCGTCNFVVAV